MHNIFISYRRDGGEIMAQMLYDRLTALGYSVFYDVVVLKGGRFNAKLLEAIEQANDFVLVLSPGALDRCSQNGDWVREEIKHAFEYKKNIIPVMLRSFAFPADLPADITEIRNQNGVDFTNMGYFEARFMSLVERLKTPVPMPTHSDAEVDADYETFFQKEMKECQTMLHLIDEHWRQLVLESGDFAPINASTDSEKLQTILSMIDTWLSEKENFETKVNASLDIRETGYIQSSKIKLEHYLESATAYQERAKAFAELFEIEKEIKEIEDVSEETFKKIESLRERSALLPDDVNEQMSSDAQKRFSALIKHLNTQIQFDREMSAVEKKFSALPEDVRACEYAFSHEKVSTAENDMSALEAVIDLCVSVCDTYHVKEENADEWILIGSHAELLDKLDALKDLLRKGKIFLRVAALCEKIQTLAASSALDREEVHTVAETVEALDEEELSYMKEASKDHFEELISTVRHTEEILEKAADVDAKFAALPAEAQSGDIRYSYDSYESAYAATVALEAWLEECKEFKKLFDGQRDKRAFTEDDVALSQSQLYRAQSVKSGYIFTSESLTVAHELEDALKEILSHKTLEPWEIIDAADRIDVLESLCREHDSNGGKRSHVKMLITKDVYDKIVLREEFLKVFYHVEDGFAFVLGETKLLLNCREAVAKGAEMLRHFREKAEQLLKDLAAYRETYEEVDLQGTSLVNYTEQAFAFEAVAEKILHSGALLDWANGKEGISAETLRKDAALRKEVKINLRAYDKIKHEAKKYDTENVLAQAFAPIKKAYSKVNISRHLGMATRVGLPTLTLLAFLLFALWVPPMVQDSFGKYIALLVGTAALNLVSLRLLPFFRKRLFFLPVLLYAAYFFGYLFPLYLLHSRYVFWYLPCFVLVGVAIVALGASVKSAAVYNFFAFWCKFIVFCSVMAIIFSPTVQIFRQTGLMRIEPMAVIDSLLNGCWDLLIGFIGGGIWLSVYNSTAFALFNAALLFGMYVRRACAYARKQLWTPKKKKEKKAKEEKKEEATAN